MRFSLRRFIAFLMSFLLFISITAAGSVADAADPGTIDIQVDQDDLLDVVLTLGQSDSDVSNVEADLTDALTAKGVPADRIKIQAVQASEVSAGNTSTGWEVYDHTNFNDASVIPYYRPYYADPYAGQVYGAGYEPQWNVENHIEVMTSGGQTDIDFRGYGSPAYKDFMYMPNTEYGKKKFDFTIQEGYFYDALDGAGFLFNTSMSPNTDLANRTMSGYLVFLNYIGTVPTLEVYQFQNIDVNTFHNNTGTRIQSYAGFTRLASSSLPGAEVTRVVAIEATSATLKMWYNGTLVDWTLAGGGTGPQVALDTDFGAYGFGPLTGYSSHGCARPTLFTFLNVTMSKESSKRFSEVIREPEWREGSKRFIINAEDGAVADFSDPVALGEILSRLGNEGIHYIGWGRDEADGGAFIAKNDGNGVFVDKDADTTDIYAEQIQAMADYIYSIYIDGIVNDTDHLMYGKPSTLTISPESEKTNTADENWPDGKWRVVHDRNYYENPTGAVPYNGLYLSNLDISFNETGRYDIYYQDTLIKTVYVHRKPLAGFTFSVDGGLNITISDTAYDPDQETAPDKGIASSAWEYRETLSDTWISGQPTAFTTDKNYIVRQTVTDHDGVAGNPYYRFISTETDPGINVSPVAEFRVTPYRLLTYNSETVGYVDTSYDPMGSAITDRLWAVSKNGTEIHSAPTPMTDFTAAGADTYKITLKVKNDGGVWSEPVARYLTVVRDDIAPTASADTAGGIFNTPQVIQLTFADEADGSGFSHRYAVVTDTVAVPGEWGSMGTNTSYSVSLDSLGIHYIHYKIHDYAGNSATGFFGPYTLADNEGPSAPIITYTPAYTPGSWAGEAITVSADGAADAFTAEGDIVYEVSIDGVNYAAGNSLTFDTEGIHTAYVRVTDDQGNSTVTSRTVKLDWTGPSSPAIDMQSGGAAYSESSLASANVSITLDGSTDGVSGLNGYQYKIDDGAWQDGDSYTFTSSGEYTIYYRAVDNAGNSSAEGSKSVRLDLEAPGEPTISYTPAYEQEWTNEDTTLTANLSTDNMTAEGDILYECSTDDVTYTEGNSVTLDTEGIHTVYFRVTDGVGNSATVSRTVKIDKTVPNTPDITLTADGGPYAEGTWVAANVTAALSGGADAGGSGLTGYQYRIDDGAWQDGDVYTFSASGQYTLHYRTVDNAGNASAEGTKSIMLDIDEPDVFAITASSSRVGSIHVKASTTDAHSGLAADAYRVYNGTDWSEWKTTVNETLTGYGRGESVTIKVEARDNTGNVRTVETTATALDNTAPEAFNDTYTVQEDAGSTRLDVLSNDKDRDAGDSVSVTGVSSLSQPEAGRAVAQGNAVSFTPAADYNGTVSFTYTVKDTRGAKDRAAVTVTVAPVNDPPTAANDSASTDEDTAVAINVLGNDKDIDSSIRIEAVGSPGNGIVNAAGNSIRYESRANFNGTDAFSYTITDGENRATARVTVTVRSVNDPPVLVPDRASTQYQTPVEINVLSNDRDAESQDLRIDSVSAPGNGRASVHNNKVTYTPARGFAGTDSFSYTVNDGGIRVSAAVTVEVAPRIYDEETTTVFTPGDSAAAPGTGATVGTPPAKGNMEQVGDDFYYTPDEGQEGVDTYSIMMDEDGDGAPTEYQVVVDIDSETGQTTTMGYGLPLTDTDIEVERNTEVRIDLSQFLTDVDDIEGISINGVSVNGDVRVEDGYLVYTPDEDFSGADAVLVTVDTGDGEVSYVATIQVLGERHVMDPVTVGGGGFPWVCLIGWVVTGALLYLNYRKHLEYYQDKKRWIIYTAVSAALLVTMCLLRGLLGYPITAAVTVLYILGNYLFAMMKTKKA